jgi:hypothetical protein
MIPRSVLYLGLLGVLPFAYCALAVVWPLIDFMQPYWGTAHRIAALYGLVILCFMSGVLWGFSTKSGGAFGYIFSVMPALWGFYITLTQHNFGLVSLIFGFGGLLLLDCWYWWQNLAPPWWMRLKFTLTVMVVMALLICDQSEFLRSLLSI